MVFSNYPELQTTCKLPKFRISVPPYRTDLVPISYPSPQELTGSLDPDPTAARKYSHNSATKEVLQAFGLINGFGPATGINRNIKAMGIWSQKRPSEIENHYPLFFIRFDDSLKGWTYINLLQLVMAAKLRTYTWKDLTFDLENYSSMIQDLEVENSKDTKVYEFKFRDRKKVPSKQNRASQDDPIKYLEAHPMISTSKPTQFQNENQAENALKKFMASRFGALLKNFENSNTQPSVDDQLEVTDETEQIIPANNGGEEEETEERKMEEEIPVINIKKQTDPNIEPYPEKALRKQIQEEDEDSDLDEGDIYDPEQRAGRFTKQKMNYMTWRNSRRLKKLGNTDNLNPAVSANNDNNGPSLGTSAAALLNNGNDVAYDDSDANGNGNGPNLGKSVAGLLNNENQEQDAFGPDVKINIPNHDDVFE